MRHPQPIMICEPYAMVAKDDSIFDGAKGMSPTQPFEGRMSAV